MYRLKPLLSFIQYRCACLVDFYKKKKKKVKELIHTTYTSNVSSLDVLLALVSCILNANCVSLSLFVIIFRSFHLVANPIHESE